MATANSNENLETANFHKLLDVIPDLMTLEEAGKSKRDGYMDLGLDVLYRSPDKLVIALSHYYLHPSGDMIPDPDMEMVVYPRQEKVAALSYQDMYGYQSVDNPEGERDTRCQQDLNKFLSQWLSNLIVQGHRIQVPLPAVARSIAYCHTTE